MREELAAKNLMEVKEILGKLGIKYWLDWGTLLGAVRDGKIIEWDHDIDLGTMDDSWEKIVSTIPEFERRGFYVEFANLKMYKNFIRKSVIFNRFGCPVGIWLYKIKDENALYMLAGPTNLISRGLGVLHHLLYFPKTDVQPKFRLIVKVLEHYLSLLPPRLKKFLSDVVWWVWRRSGIEIARIVIPKHYFEKLGVIKFYGMTFNIPSDVEGYLEYHYGKDWKTPKKRWLPGEDDGAIRILTV